MEEKGSVNFGLVICNCCGLNLFCVQYEEQVNLLGQHPLGLGVGGYGNLGKLYGLLDVEGSGESFFGSAIGQLGVLAIVLYLYFYTKLFKRLKRIKTPLSEIILQLNIGLLLTSFFNNTAISFTGCYIFFVLAALCIKENTCLQIYERVKADKPMNHGSLYIHENSTFWKTYGEGTVNETN